MNERNTSDQPKLQYHSSSSTLPKSAVLIEEDLIVIVLYVAVIVECIIAFDLLLRLLCRVPLAHLLVTVTAIKIDQTLVRQTQPDRVSEWYISMVANKPAEDKAASVLVLALRSVSFLAPVIAQLTAGPAFCKAVSEV
jgi:hypothetical protein